MDASSSLPLPHGDDTLAVLSTIGLTYVSDTEPGIRRFRRGRSFCYKLPDGSLLAEETHKLRIGALGLPPAYQDVWICLDPRGHLQATGLDSRGRKQYRYHADWQLFRSEQKYDQLVRFGEALPKIRRRVQRDIAAGLAGPEAVIAALVALLDATYLRVGNRAYARENKTYGATTLLKRHMKMSDDGVVLRFTAKGGKRVSHTIRHPRLQRILEDIADLPGRQLFSWPDEDGVPHSIDSGRLNAYLAEVSGLPVSAKTFRTWGGSLAAFMAAWKAVSNDDPVRIKMLTKAASEELLNTPAVCRSSYIHPSILALSEDVSPLRKIMDTPKLVAQETRGLKADERRLLAFLKLSS